MYFFLKGSINLPEPNIVNNYFSMYRQARTVWGENNKNNTENQCKRIRYLSDYCIVAKIYF